MYRFLITVGLIFIFSQNSASLPTSSELLRLAKQCNGTFEDTCVLMLYIPPKSETGKCLLSCILKETKMINQNGFYDKEQTAEYLKTQWKAIRAEHSANVSEKCHVFANTIATEGLENCEYAYRVTNCVVNEMKTYGYFKLLSGSLHQAREKFVEAAKISYEKAVETAHAALEKFGHYANEGTNITKQFFSQLIRHQNHREI